MTTIQHYRRGAGWPGVSAVLDRARAALLGGRRADVELLVAALEWAVSHPASSVYDVAGWGDEDLYGEGFLPLAGEGAPWVTEFAPCELAAELGWSTDPAKQLMGDALGLAYRLPGLWRLTVDLVVPVHLARYAADHTRDLGPEAAAHADCLLTRAPRLLTQSRIRDLVNEARLYHDPDRAIDDEHRALIARKVELAPGSAPATTEVHLILDSLDAVAFDRAVTPGADALRSLGDHDPLDIRRARAVGILADPQRALELFSGREPGRPKPAATLILHPRPVTARRPRHPPGRYPLRGTRRAVLGPAHAWLADTTLVVKPVLDLRRTDQVDQHDPPAWMADLVRLRDPICVFPGCHRTSRICDLDHIEPCLPIGVGGPPGQTHPDNLASR